MHVWAVTKLIIAVELFILNHQRNFIFPRRQIQTAFFSVIDDHSSSHPHIKLPSSLMMGVGVVNIHAGTVEHFKLVDEAFALGDSVMG